MPGSEWCVTSDGAGERLDKFLAHPDRLGSRAKALAAIQRGKVFLDGVEATSHASTRLTPGAVVRVWMDRPGSAKRRPWSGTRGELMVVYEDDDLLVVDKPAGVLAVPLERRREAPSVFDQIEEQLRSHGKRRPLVVHRIDRDTSGLVVFAKDARSQLELKGQFRRREPERVYWAVVYGWPDPAEGTWRDHLVWDTKALIQKETHPSDPQGTEAISHYRVLETFAGTSLIEVKLGSGRRNQIRIQARLRGHTLVGERRYVYGPETLRPVSFERQALHARSLSFRHPSDGRVLRFESEPPADFADLLSRLRRRDRD